MRELADAFGAARAGDEAGFALLWRAYQPGLLRYLRVVAGAAAEDLASETWLQVARDLSGFRGDHGGVKGWLFPLARNPARDHPPRGRRRPGGPGQPASIPDCARTHPRAPAVA